MLACCIDEHTTNLFAIVNYQSWRATNDDSTVVVWLHPNGEHAWKHCGLTAVPIATHVAYSTIFIDSVIYQSAVSALHVHALRCCSGLC